jgi:hypothetical protein
MVFTFWTTYVYFCVPFLSTTLAFRNQIAQWVKRLCYGLDNQRIGIQCWTGAELSLCHCIQTKSEFKPVSYATVPRGSCNQSVPPITHLHLVLKVKLYLRKKAKAHSGLQLPMPILQLYTCTLSDWWKLSEHKVKKYKLKTASLPISSHRRMLEYHWYNDLSIHTDHKPSMW